MTHLEVIKLLRAEVSRAQSQCDLATKWDVTPCYMSDVLNYRRKPGRKILDPLGLEKVVTIDYRQKEPQRCKMPS